MINVRSIILSVFYLILFVDVAKADSITSIVQKKYDNITSMTSDFTQMLTHKESGAKETRKGVLFFKKPLLVRWETKTPDPELLIVTGKEIWNVFPDEETAYKYPISMIQDSNNIIHVITGQTRLEQDFTIKEEGKENGFVKLHLYPKEPVQSMVEAFFWVDSISGFIQKVRIFDFYGNINEISFSNQKIGIPILKSEFTYLLPKNYVLEDRTKNNVTVQKPFMQ